MKNGTYILKEDVDFTPTLQFKKNQEFEVVDKVVYVNGFPLPFDMQIDVYQWMDINNTKFINDTRNF